MMTGAETGIGAEGADETTMTGAATATERGAGTGTTAATGVPLC